MSRNAASMRNSRPLPACWPASWVFYLTGGILLVVGVLFAWDGLARRSRLRQPEAFLLKPDKLEHLVGRSEDIDRLSRECIDHRQIHLVGESGAGKSAAGLCPRLKAHATLLPVYVDAWGDDWEVGPRESLAKALGIALSEEDQPGLGLPVSFKPEELRATIEQAAAKLGRTPLLIFDQFDDYQSRHRSKFLHGERHTLLPAEKLIEDNSFWHDIKELIDEGVVRCLFVTRDDSGYGLESVRFVAPQVYRLDRLQVDFVEPLLTSLTTPVEGANPIVSAPEKGWDRLKNRLARDLGGDGTVLPAQMKIVLQGLASLGALTVREYERKGGLRGLEAAHVERHVASTSRHSNLTKSQIRTPFLWPWWIGRNSQGSRSPRINYNRLSAKATRAIPCVSSRALKPPWITWSRHRSYANVCTPTLRLHVWVLDHDYLCRGVLEAERKAAQWLVFAEERQRAFRDAGDSIWRSWQSLLGPWQQTVLASLRLLGRFHYGDLRSYATWSLLRFIPYFLILGGTVCGWATIRARLQTERDLDLARSILTASTVDYKARDYLNHMWELVGRGDDVRHALLSLPMRSAYDARSFLSKDDLSDVLIHSVVGLSLDGRRRIFEKVIHPFVQRPGQDCEMKAACLIEGLTLSVEDCDFAVFAIQTLTEIMRELPPCWKENGAPTLSWDPSVVERLKPDDAWKGLVVS